MNGYHACKGLIIFFAFARDDCDAACPRKQKQHLPLSSFYNEQHETNCFKIFNLSYIKKFSL